MVDVVSVSQRSRMMAGIRGKDTKPELLLRRALHASGFRYRLHDKRLPGRPDMVFPRHKAVVLVHGCFWHGHEGCRYFRVPGTRRDFWEAKIETNRARDRRDVALLIDKGWRVAVVWECATRSQLEAAVRQLETWLKGSSVRLDLASSGTELVVIEKSQ